RVTEARVAFQLVDARLHRPRVAVFLRIDVRGGDDADADDLLVARLRLFGRWCLAAGNQSGPEGQEQASACASESSLWTSGLAERLHGYLQFETLHENSPVGPTVTEARFIGTPSASASRMARESLGKRDLRRM